MGLKDMMRDDIRDVFLDLDEFGELHMVDGMEMAAVIDEEELARRESRYRTLAEGLHERRLLLFVAAQDYGGPPLIGRQMELDGEYYAVSDVSDEGGIYAISLEANES